MLTHLCGTCTLLLAISYGPSDVVQVPQLETPALVDQKTMLDGRSCLHAFPHPRTAKRTPKDEAIQVPCFFRKARSLLLEEQKQDPGRETCSGTIH